MYQVFCDQCGRPVSADAVRCPHCGHRFIPLSSAPVRPHLAVLKGDGPRLALGGLPRLRAWGLGMVSNVRGWMTGLFAAWFNLPFVVLMAGVGAFFGGLAGLFSGTFAGAAVLDRIDKFQQWILPLPVGPEQLLPTAAAQIGGVIGGILGAVNGAVKLAWMAFIWPWQILYAGDPMWPFAVAVGQVVTGLVIGALWTAGVVLVEPWWVQVAGARRLSRREAVLLDPIAAEVAGRLGLATLPVLLVNDTREPRVELGVRTVILGQGFLDQWGDDREAIAAVLAYELAHWRAGDPIAEVWSRGVALPLWLVHIIATKMIHASRWRPLQFLLRVLLWPVLWTVRYVVAPMRKRGIRESVYAADAAAAAAGYGLALRRVLALHRTTFDMGRTGWAQVMLASHPAAELRMERLEEGRRFALREDRLTQLLPGFERGSTVKRTRRDG